MTKKCLSCGNDFDSCCQGDLFCSDYCMSDASDPEVIDWIRRLEKIKDEIDDYENDIGDWKRGCVWSNIGQLVSMVIDRLIDVVRK